MTTLPTAIIPSRLERLDSKYMARAIQSISVADRATRDELPHPARTQRMPNVRMIRLLVQGLGKFRTFRGFLVADVKQIRAFQQNLMQTRRTCSYENGGLKGRRICRLSCPSGWIDRLQAAFFTASVALSLA